MATSPTHSVDAPLDPLAMDHRRAVDLTLTSMRAVVSPSQLTHFSNRSIAEVEALQQEVSAVVPAGNIVGLIMGGLVRLRDRHLPRHKASADVSALMRGLDLLPRHILPRTIYGTLFVGPAAVLSAYQKLLTLTGKDPESAFPDGLWQFYLEFALREDTARHTNETLGFQQALRTHALNLSPSDQLAAWVCTVCQSYFQYDDWLANEWRERVYLNLIEEAAHQAKLNSLSFKKLHQAWAAQRPYHRGPDVKHSENFAAYRRRRFDAFLHSRLSLLPSEARLFVEDNFRQRAETDLPGFQQQMSLLASLNPDQYRENKQPIELWQAHVGVIVNGNYYLLPAYHVDQSGQPVLFETQAPDSPFYALVARPDGRLYDPAGFLLQVDRTGRVYRANSAFPRGYLRPASFQAIRRQVAALMTQAELAETSSSLDEQLIAIKRSHQGRARHRLIDPVARREIEALKTAPVLINWDERNGHDPLAYIRRGKRGLGDHALTIFRSSTSMAFDWSHIFVDGVWSTALAEILTGEAISWAVYFNTLPTPQASSLPPYHLRLAAQPALNDLPATPSIEAAAETASIDMNRLRQLRLLLPKRHADLHLTVNDLLVLFRSLFGHAYQPSPALDQKLAEFESSQPPRAVLKQVKLALDKMREANPCLVIPMDATAARPRERLYPTTFRNPFTDLWDHYQQTGSALDRFSLTGQAADWSVFAEARRLLLAQLYYFGQVIRAYKKVGLEGGSTSTATMKLLAHLPDSLLKLLEEIPQRIDILNEVLKGEEVFSNIGRVVRGSSISRFISAKDDNQNKSMVWAVVTDDSDVMHLALRDFRPHVTALAGLGRRDLAELMVQDFIAAFTAGFNHFVARLIEILSARGVQPEVHL